jgi:hypothetical protein
MIPTQKPPHIVVLDAGHLLDGGLDWGDVARLGRLEVHHSTAPAEVTAHAAAAHVVLTNKTPLRSISSRTRCGIPPSWPAAISARPTPRRPVPARRGGWASDL